jgi:hypothetical protein
MNSTTSVAPHLIVAYDLSWPEQRRYCTAFLCGQDDRLRSCLLVV